MAAPNETQRACLGLIPARSGSVRIPGKNVKPLAGLPLVVYSIASALDSGVFAKVVVSTDSKEIGGVAQHYGADVLIRPPEYATDISPDIEWVRHALTKLPGYAAFAILRPTSPFRKAETIRRAWREFLGSDAHSLRAVEKVSQHPAKMWVIRNGYLHNLMPFGPESQPWHSSQMPTLPPVFVQNASLEIAWTYIVEDMGSISGEVIKAFHTFDDEGYDLNTLHDWQIAEAMVSTGVAKLPEVKCAEVKA